MSRNDVITHLQIIHTWAAFAHKKGMLLGMPEICDIEKWTMDALELLKDGEAPVKKLSSGEYCGNCDSFVRRFDKYCHECGKKLIR